MILTIDAVYLASMFDHQGGVFISKVIKKTFVKYRLDVIFTNRNPKALHEFREKLNYLGTIRPDGNSWRWFIPATGALELLLMIQPHLRLKADQVELGVRFSNTIGYWKSPKKKLKSKILEEREYCYQQMKVMKKLKYAKGGTNV